MASAGVLAVASLFCLLWLVPNHTQAAMSPGDISPAFFPMAAALTVLILCVGMFLSRLTKSSATPADLSGMTILSETGIWLVAATALFIVLPVIGFIPTSIATIALSSIAIHYKRWWIIAVLAVAFTLVVDFGAWQIFTVDLP